MPTPAFLHRRVIMPIRSVLTMGITPKRLALSMATGSLTGIFPFLGTTTALCTLFALGFRLNLVVMQAFNWLVAGLQLILILPFMRLGEKLYGADPIPLTREQLEDMFSEGFFHTIQTMGTSLVHAISGWAVVAPILFPVIYFSALPIVSRMRRNSAPLQ